MSLNTRKLALIVACGLLGATAVAAPDTLPRETCVPEAPPSGWVNKVFGLPQTCVEPAAEKPPVAKPPAVKPPVEKPPVGKSPVVTPPVVKPPVVTPPVVKPPVVTPPVVKPPVVKPPVVKPPVVTPPVVKSPVAVLPVVQAPGHVQAPEIDPAATVGALTLLLGGLLVLRGRRTRA